MTRMSPEDYRDTFWAMLRDAIDQVGNIYSTKHFPSLSLAPLLLSFHWATNTIDQEYLHVKWKIRVKNTHILPSFTHLSINIHILITTDADPSPWLLQTNLIWADVQCCVQVSDSLRQVNFPVQTIFLPQMISVYISKICQVCLQAVQWNSLQGPVQPHEVIYLSVDKLNSWQ